MKNLVKKLSLAISTLAVVGLPLLVAQPTAAVNVWQGCETGAAANSPVCNAPEEESAENIVKSVINTMLLVLGMIAVIMITIGGIRYTTSNGDSGQIKSAKDTILYSVIGLVVAIMAFAIVNFVVDAFTSGGAPTP
jgi:heme/copper-type cytochrome/quinol oxidase subunit 2